MKASDSTAQMRVLIVEDHEGLAELLVEEVRDAGWDARRAASAEKALPLMKTWRPDLVVSDLRLPGMDGVELLQQIKALPHPPFFLIITAFGTVEQAVAALKAGADDFMTKPLDLEHFLHRVGHFLEVRRLQDQVQGMREAMGGDDFQGIFGRSKAMLDLFGQLQQVAPARGPVLILGESGSGKELVARAIHRLSPRSGEAFLAVNCAGVPESLMESEFFGHEEGAFTGSTGSRNGLFVEASGGTLFLDEIAEMPMSLQSKLLRILQDGKVRRVGANTEQEVDVRILAATHRNLEGEVSEGRFREDLFYRLETFNLRVPPLKERGDDVELLANRFLMMFASSAGKRVRGFSAGAMEKIRSYPFPGNVRELRNAVERAVTFCEGSTIRLEHLPARMRSPGEKTVVDAAVGEWMSSDRVLTLEEVERAYIRQVLDSTGGNKKRAAELLGITRRTLYNRLGGG